MRAGAHHRVLLLDGVAELLLLPISVPAVLAVSVLAKLLY